MTSCISFRDPLTPMEAIMNNRYSLFCQSHPRAMLDYTDIKIWDSQIAIKCTACGKNSSKHCRECPICHWLIAPECRPNKCWSDELNICRACYELIEVLKHLRLKKQYPFYYGRRELDKIQPTVHDWPAEIPVAIETKIVSYATQPTAHNWPSKISAALQVRIMSYIFPIKNLCTKFHFQELREIRQMCLINYDLEPDDLPMMQILDPLGEFKEGTKESTDGPAVYCDDCEMWLNGSREFEDHKISKKHNKNLRRKNKHHHYDRRKWAF